MRGVFLVLHRYMGLALASFLTVSGLTGSVIAFNHELDEMLNPALFSTPGMGPALAPDRLRAIAEATKPDVRVIYLPVDLRAGDAAVLGAAGRPGSGLEDDYVELFLDPTDGALLGERIWGACCFQPRQLLPFLYRIHDTLLLPESWGMLLLGVVAIFWCLDCLVGLCLTLPRGRPRLRRWLAFWTLKPRAGPYRRLLDQHRAGALWFWVLLLIMASSGLSLTLYNQVFRPLVALIADLSPDPWDEAASRDGPGAPIGFAEALRIAAEQGRARSWSTIPIGVYHAAEHHAYAVFFSDPGTEHKAGLGGEGLYLDDRTGALLFADIPGSGTAGDIFLEAQLPLHSGMIAGLPGRIAVSVTGLAVAGLSVTGVMIWARKRRRDPLKT